MPEVPPDPVPDRVPEADYLLSAQSHDAYFKKVFSDPAYATGFFRQHLPPEVVAGIAWEGLALVPGSFVKRTLQQSHADLLFSVKAGGEELLLYLLFEHQTTVDPAMPLRLLAYMTEIWLAHRKTEGGGWPAILPFVLHQGPERWTVPLNFRDLLTVAPPLAGAMRRFLPSFEYGLLDLSQCNPATEEADATLRVVLQLMKVARQQRRMLEFFEWLAGHLPPLPEALLHLTLLYALHHDGDLDVGKIADTLKRNPALKNKAMSLAEKLIAQGRNEGRNEGWTEGLNEGRSEGLNEGRKEGENIGVWKGKILLLEQMMGGARSVDEELDELSPAGLEARFKVLEAQYQARFKQS